MELVRVVLELGQFHIFDFHEGDLSGLGGTILMEKNVSKLSISQIMVLRTSEMFIRRKMLVATTEILWLWLWAFIYIPYSIATARRLMDRKSQISESP